MIHTGIFIISVLALLIDWYIYRRIVRRNIWSRAWRRAYVIYAIVIDLVVIAGLGAYNFVLTAPTNTALHCVMWVIALFFINAVPKLVYAMVSLGDYPLGLITHRRMHWFGHLGTALGAVALVVMLWGATIGRSRIEVRRVELHSERLPQSFNGLRVVQVSDIHVGTMINPEKMLRRMVDTINSLRADIVVVSGDLVNTHAGELTPQVTGILSGIESKYGTFSVLGNHDLGFYIHDSLKITPRRSIELVLEAQQRMGWTPLAFSSQMVSNGADSIVVSGIDFPQDFRSNGHRRDMVSTDLSAMFSSVPDSLYNIVITHAPQLWGNLMAEQRGDLTLAGHVHSMQMKFGWGERKWSPASLLYDWWSGLYENNGRYLYVNDGMGYVLYPIRIGTQPEVTLIEIFAQ